MSGLGSSPKAFASRVGHFTFHKGLLMLLNLCRCMACVLRPRHPQHMLWDCTKSHMDIPITAFSSQALELHPTGLSTVGAGGAGQAAGSAGVSSSSAGALSASSPAFDLSALRSAVLDCDNDPAFFASRSELAMAGVGSSFTAKMVDGQSDRSRGVVEYRGEGE